jgi:hypothetical protein
MPAVSVGAGADKSRSRSHLQDGRDRAGEALLDLRDELMVLVLPAVLRAVGAFRRHR